jgi:glycosyltransferase involved in cell wall biosynthesis
MGASMTDRTRGGAVLSGNRPPLNILFVIDGTAAGGAEQSLLSLIRSLDRLKFRPVLFNTGFEGPLTHAFMESTDRFYSFPKKRRFDLDLVRRLTEVAQMETAELIVSVLFYADVIAGLAANFVSVPVLAWQHALPSIDPKNNRWYHRLAHRLARSNFTAAVCCGDTVRSDVREFHKPVYPLYTVCNGIDPDRFFRDSTGNPGKFIVGTACRLSPGKGIQYVLPAVSAVAERVHGIHLKIAGDGTETESLKKMSVSLGIENRVEFCGYVDHVESFLSGLDCFVLASENEAFPVSILEAMAASCPVVASDLPGIREIIDSSTGLLFPVGDIGTLARHLTRLSEGPRLRRKLAAAARNRVVTRFRTDRQHDRLCAVMESTARRIA